MNESISLSDFDCLVFDMDGTLAVSKGPISSGMAQCLNNLLKVKKVAVISGGEFSQFEKQLIAYIHPENLGNLFILPTSGMAMYAFSDGQWKKVYNEIIPNYERKNIIAEIKRALDLVGYHEAETFGPVIDDRLSQITFSGLGGEAPFEKKSLWDPDQKKRQLIVAILKDRIPNFTITMGGTTSIDITLKGVDKAYGIEKLSNQNGIPLSRTLFIGDKLDPGGNDYPVKSLGIKTVAVTDEHETERLLNSWLA